MTFGKRREATSERKRDIRHFWFNVQREEANIKEVAKDGFQLNKAKLQQFPSGRLPVSNRLCFHKTNWNSRSQSVHL